MQARFRATTTYNEEAYKALTNASFHKNRKRQMQIYVYPVMFVFIVLIILLLVDKRAELTFFHYLVSALFIGLIVIAIPIGERNNKRKHYKEAIKKAKQDTGFPNSIFFIFYNNKISYGILDKKNKSKLKEDKNDINYDSVRYEKVTDLIQDGDWLFLYFGNPALIIDGKNLENKSEIEKLKIFLEEKTNQVFRVI